MAKHRCAACGIGVEPANWYRLASGFLMCGECYWKACKKRKANDDALLSEVERLRAAHNGEVCVDVQEAYDAVKEQLRLTNIDQVNTEAALADLLAAAEWALTALAEPIHGNGSSYGREYEHLRAAIARARGEE